MQAFCSGVPATATKTNPPHARVPAAHVPQCPGSDRMGQYGVDGAGTAGGFGQSETHAGPGTGPGSYRIPVVFPIGAAEAEALDCAAIGRLAHFAFPKGVQPATAGRH